MSKAALISIHPRHVRKILNGTKRFEFRRNVPKANLAYLVLYSTAPEKQIVAVAEVTGRIIDSPAEVWRQTSAAAGISNRFFADYFLGREKAAALCLGEVFKLSRPVSLDELPTDRVAPQSFFYLTPEDLSFLSTFSNFEPEDEHGGNRRANRKIYRSRSKNE